MDRNVPLAHSCDEVSQALHFDRKLLQQHSPDTAVVVEAGHFGAARLGLDDGWHVNVAADALVLRHEVRPPRDRAVGEQLGHRLARPFHVPRLDRVSSSEVLVRLDSADQRGLKACSPQAVQGRIRRRTLPGLKRLWGPVAARTSHCTQNAAFFQLARSCWCLGISTASLFTYMLSQGPRNSRRLKKF